jgi:hypothetical protein
MTSPRGLRSVDVMAEMDRSAQRQTWLLELYEPGATATVLHGRIREMAVAARRGGAVVVLASVVVPEDEQALCLVEARTASAIRKVCRQSRFRPDRLIRVEPATEP